MTVVATEEGMAAKLKQLTVGDLNQFRQAYIAWGSGAAYLQGRNYRLRVGGRIAPWNKIVKQMFKGSNHSFHRATKLYHDDGEFFLPFYLNAGNVRITRFPANLFVVEVWDENDRIGQPRFLGGLAHNIIMDAFRLKFPHALIWHGVGFNKNPVWTWGNPGADGVIDGTGIWDKPAARW